MATRTTTTRTTRSACAPSADLFDYCHADFSFEALVQAYLDCRKSKRNSASALRFEISLERNLVQLDAELRNGTYRPGRSICFVITRPKPREVWAADFRDRIVHHLLYNHVAPRIHARFIDDSCACIPGRGTLYGAQRLEKKASSITKGWTVPAFYLKCDLANTGEPIPAATAIKAIRNIKIDASVSSATGTGNFSSNLTLMESTTVDTSSGLPHFIRYRCTPYKDLDEREFLVRVGVGKDAGGNTVFSLQIVRHDLAVQEMADELAELITRHMTNASVYLGSFTKKTA